MQTPQSSASPSPSRAKHLHRVFLMAAFSVGLLSSLSLATTELIGCREYGEMSQKLGAIDPGFFYGECFAEQNDIVYAAGSSHDRITIIDIADPESLQLMGTLEVGGIVTGLAAGPGVLLATIEDLGLVRFDLSAPLVPVSGRSPCSFPGWPLTRCSKFGQSPPGRFGKN